MNTNWPAGDGMDLSYFTTFAEVRRVVVVVPGVPAFQEAYFAPWMQAQVRGIGGRY